MFEAGLKSTADLSFLRAYDNEEDYNIWRSIESSLNKISNLLSGTDLQHKINPYGHRLMRKFYQKLGWDPKPDEPVTNNMLRGFIIGIMGDFKDTKVAAEAKERFKQHINGGKEIIRELKSSVHKIAATNKTDEELDTLLKLHSNATGVMERYEISEVLVFSASRSQIERIMEFALSTFKDRSDLRTVFQLVKAVSTSYEGRQLAWEFMKQHREQLEKEDSDEFYEAMEQIAVGFETEEKATEVADFFSEFSLSRADDSIQRVLAEIRFRADWFARDGAILEAYFSSFAEN